MKKPYVAIVDDDAGFAQYLRTFLSLRGYEARCYTRGDELLASMKQNEAPDVVLLDVMMPGLDGMATLRALKASIRRCLSDTYNAEPKDIDEMRTAVLRSRDGKEGVRAFLEKRKPVWSGE